MENNKLSAIVAKLQAELKEEQSAFAYAFHKGKSMADLKKIVDKIHRLQDKLKLASAKVQVQ